MCIRDRYWSHDSSLFFLSEIIARVHLQTNKSSWCLGDILQLDAQITFRSTALPGLKRLSVDEIKNADYVSREKVVFEKLKKGETILFFKTLLFGKCLRVGILLSYDLEWGLLKLGTIGAQRNPYKRLNEVYYTKSSTGKNVNGIKAFQVTDNGEYRSWHP